MHSFRSTLLILVFLGIAAAQTRIHQPVDTGRTVLLNGHVHPRALPQYDQGPLDPATELHGLTLYLKPSLALEGFLAELQTPSSPNYHRWLTPGQFGERFGLSLADLDTVSNWLRSQGLKVEGTAHGRHWIAFSGTAAAISRGFHTSLHRYRVDGESHFANTSSPAIPAALADVVAGIQGLTDFRPKSFAIRSDVRPDYNTGGINVVVPDDFATIYNLSPLYAAGTDGTGQTIAIIGASRIDVADITAFRKRFNLPPLNLQQFPVGADPGKNGALIEADLDIEWASAIARGAQIDYVYGQDVYTAGQYAVDQNLAPVISLSFGDCETAPVPAFRSIVQQANAQGITWIVASGDSGAATCDYQSSPTPQATKGATVAFPASLPEVTAVGGTEFNEGSARVWAAVNGANFGSALSYISEVVWNNAAALNTLLGAGGGASALFSKPAWQKAPGVPDDNARDIPDLVFNASPIHDPYWVNSGGSAVGVGGTSASAPAFAGIVALLNQRYGNGAGLGNINPQLYAVARATTDVFHDIVTGDNRMPCQQSTAGCVNGTVGYSAGPGYDLATGLGSVDASRLLDAWNAAKASATSLTVTPGSAGFNDSVQLTATVGGSGGGAAPTGSVAFLANDNLIGSADLKSSGGSAVATFAAPASQFSIGASSITALYSGDGAFTSSSAVATLSVALPASGAAVVPSIDPNPAYGQPADAAGPVWAYSITLTEKAGVAAALTGFTIDGVTQSLAPFGTGRIRANGSLTALINERNVATPANRVMVFSGTDTSGQTWSQQLTVPFIAPVLYPNIILRSSSSTVQQNPSADPSCQFQHRVTVVEQSGFQVSLTKFTAGADFSKQIQQLFGTTRLAPHGILQADLCQISGISGPRTLSISGVAEDGTTVSATLPVTYAAAAASPATPAVSAPLVNIPLAEGTQTGSAQFDLTFAAGTAAWTVAKFPVNSSTSWLTVSPASGSGPGQLTLKGSAAGLSNGVYNAVVSIQFANSQPQFIDVPVVMTVGASPAISIAGVANNASGGAAIAPGMQVAVFGSGLAGDTGAAVSRPLPLGLLGVSATVNGVTAPLYYVSPGQLDLQIPYETGSGTAVLAVNNNGKVASFTFPMTPVAPGAFNVIINNSAHGTLGAGSAGDVMTLFITGEGDVTPTLATGVAPANGTPSNRLPQPRMQVGVIVGGIPATVNFSGITTGLVGVTQINFTIPPRLPAGTAPVVVSVGGVAAPPIDLTIQ